VKGLGENECEGLIIFEAMSQSVGAKIVEPLRRHLKPFKIRYPFQQVKMLKLGIENGGDVANSAPSPFEPGSKDWPKRLPSQNAAENARNAGT
jgi:hypothetical protein